MSESNDPTTPAVSRDEAPAERKPTAAGPAPKRSRTRVMAIATVAVVLVAAGGWYWDVTKDIESTDDAQTDGNVVTITPKVAGYVVEMPLVDNQPVKAGTLLLKIDPRDYLASRAQAKAALDLAMAERDNARANLDIVAVSAPVKLIQARAQRDAALASHDSAAAEAGRQTDVDRQATTQQAIDQARAQAQTARSTLTSDEAQVRVAALVPQNIAQARAQLEQADAQVGQARAQLEAADLNLANTEVRAPQDGWIAKRNVQLGGYVQAGQSLLSLVTTDLWITANFKEDQLRRMQIGQPVTIKADAFPKLALRGHVDSLQMGTGSRFTAFPAENATGNFVKIVQRVPVKIVIDSGLDPKQPLPLGLSVAPKVALN